MSTQTVRHQRYYDDYIALRQQALGGPAWLEELRASAWERFNALGFPTARRGNERWKYTNVAPIARGSFVYPFSTTERTENTEFTFGFPVVSAVSEFDKEHEGEIRQHLGSLARFGDDGFTALNTAFLQNVALVCVPDGYEETVKVCVNHVSRGNSVADTEGLPPVTHPRTLIIAGANTNLTVVESYIGPAGPRYFTNAVSEIVVGDGAHVDHYRLLLESPAAYHVGTTRVSQGKDSFFESSAFSLGTSLGRNDFSVTLGAPGCYCSLNGLYHTTGQQHMDNLISIDHAMPNCTSRLKYKGILDGRSRAVFGGEVLVRENAQKSDAQQSDKNLLLSEEAEVDSKPSLLIYADDVKCSHGATAGHIDADTIFYLRSRGLDLEEASRILVHAFAREIIDSVKPGPLREYLDTLFDRSIGNKSLPVGSA